MGGTTHHWTRARRACDAVTGRRAPFTVLIPDTVPANWQVQCRFVNASQRPPSPVEIGVIYRSTDGHESVSLSQCAIAEPNAYRRMGHGENRGDVTRGGIPMKTRPARWGQAQVELELHDAPAASRAERPLLLAAGGRSRAREARP
jgi:hypothetical protein